MHPKLFCDGAREWYNDKTIEHLHLDDYGEARAGILTHFSSS